MKIENPVNPKPTIITKSIKIFFRCIHNSQIKSALRKKFILSDNNPPTVYNIIQNKFNILVKLQGQQWGTSLNI